MAKSRDRSIEFLTLLQRFGQPILRRHGLPTAELQFDELQAGRPLRNWRFDWAWTLPRVAVEIDGGIWVGGRHTRGRGFANDCEKTNRAAALGWRVLRIPADWLSQRPVDVLEWVGGALSR